MTQSKKQNTVALEASTALEVPSKSDMATGDAILTPGQEEALAACAERLVALGRMSTVQAFDYGEELAKAQEILPPKKFGAWLSVNSGIKTKAAKNYTRVYKELATYRERLEKAAVAPTAMFALLGADNEAIETVLDALEGGERLTVDDIKSMLGATAKPETLKVDLFDMPGMVGCIKVAEDRLKTQIAHLYKLLGNVLVHVEQAAENFAAGKRVIKSDLAAMIELDSRHASDLFSLTLAPVCVEPFDPRSTWKSKDFGNYSAWSRFQKAIRQAGGEDSWPVKEAFRPWIVEELYPLLKFAIRGVPLVGDTTSAEVAAVDADAIQVGDEPHDLNAPRIQMDAPTLQSDNVVALAGRQNRKKAIDKIDA